MLSASSVEDTLTGLPPAVQHRLRAARMDAGAARVSNSYVQCSESGSYQLRRAARRVEQPAADLMPFAPVALPPLVQPEVFSYRAGTRIALAIAFLCLIGLGFSLGARSAAPAASAAAGPRLFAEAQGDIIPIDEGAASGGTGTEYAPVAEEEAEYFDEERLAATAPASAAYEEEYLPVQKPFRRLERPALAAASRPEW